MVRCGASQGRPRIALQGTHPAAVGDAPSATSVFLAFSSLCWNWRPPAAPDPDAVATDATRRPHGRLRGRADPVRHDLQRNRGVHAIALHVPYLPLREGRKGRVVALGGGATDRLDNPGPRAFYPSTQQP